MPGNRSIEINAIIPQFGKGISQPLDASTILMSSMVKLLARPMHLQFQETRVIDETRCLDGRLRPLMCASPKTKTLNPQALNRRNTYWVSLNS